MAPNEKGDKFLKLAKRAGLSGRSAARLERAVKSAAEMYALDKDFRQGALGKKRMADAQALDGLSELALRVDRALRGRGAYNNFVYALDALSHSAKAAL